jgi:hypothetical protein
MTPLQISEELAKEIWDEANTRGLPVEDFLREVLQRERTLANRHKIEQEQTWWLSLPLSERARYEGRYVAVHDKAVVDHDKDPEALRRRIRAKYDNTAILMMPAEGPREIHIRMEGPRQRIRLS